MPFKSRNPWPIVIAAYFALFFSGLVAFIIYATTQHVDLVRADYYEQEMRYQQQVERVNRTQQMAQPVAVAYDAAQQRISITLPSAHAHGSAGRIHLYRPSDASLDQEIQLAVNAAGTQRLDASKLRPGLWKVRLQWTTQGQEYYFDQPLVIAPHHRS